MKDPRTIWIKFHVENGHKALIRPIILARNLIREAIKDCNEGNISYQEYDYTVRMMKEFSLKHEKVLFESLTN